MKIVIPMAGRGSRFAEKGYTFPKPLIDVRGKPMIELVISTLPKADEYIFICQGEHLSKYNLCNYLHKITNNKAIVISLSEITEGAACTALLAKDFLTPDEPLLIANSDQFVKYSIPNFDLLAGLGREQLDGIIFTFKATHPKWSFVEILDQTIMRVVEKEPISDNATCGIYYWNKASDFIESAEAMIAANDRVNNEFYIAPTFNYLINNSKWIAPFWVDEMHGLGTPEDLEVFLRNG